MILAKMECELMLLQYNERPECLIDIVIANSMESSSVNDAYMNTKVAGNKDGTRISFKAPLYLGHVEEFYYISLMFKSSKLLQTTKAEVDNDILNCSATTAKELAQEHEKIVPNICTLEDIGYAVENHSR
jgi:hypothetical protein